MLFFFFNYSSGTSSIFFLVYNRATTYHPRSITKEKGGKKTQFDQFYCNKIKESSDRRASKLHDSNLVKTLR